MSKKKVQATMDDFVCDHFSSLIEVMEKYHIISFTQSQLTIIIDLFNGKKNKSYNEIGLVGMLLIARGLMKKYSIGIFEITNMKQAVKDYKERK